MKVAAFINDGRIHDRPQPRVIDYPDVKEKPIDFPIGPFAVTFSQAYHQFGPYKPIIDYWKAQGLKPVY